MIKPLWNWPAWAGLLLSVLAFASYFVVFIRFPITRDVPWVNFLLFAAAVLLLLAGLKKAFSAAGSLAGKFVSSALALVSLSILGAFGFIVFHASRQLPASLGSPRVGHQAPDFTLRDTRDNPVSLSALLTAPLDPAAASRVAPRGVLLVFYRGYW